MRTQIRKIEDTIKYYELLYSEDGEIDDFEQKQIDKLNQTLGNVKLKVEGQIKKLNPLEIAKNNKSTIQEISDDEASTEDDIVDHSLVKEKPLSDTGELNTDIQLYKYWNDYKSLAQEWDNTWFVNTKNYLDNNIPFPIDFINQGLLFLEKLKMVTENYLDKYEELQNNLSTATRESAIIRKGLLEPRVIKWLDYIQQFTEKKEKIIAKEKLVLTCDKKIEKLNDFLIIWGDEILPNIKSLLVTKKNLQTVQEIYNHILEMRTFFDSLPEEYQELFEDHITRINKGIWQERLEDTKLKFEDSEKKKNPAKRADGNPNLPKDKEKSLMYEKPKKSAQLYEKGRRDTHKIDDNDLQQEELNNCFALSAIAAIANTDPKLIGNIIEEKSDGSFEVTLYIRTDPKSKERTKTIITVKREFLAPKGSGRASVGKGDFNELWPKVLDRAIAEAFGGYDVLDNKGFSEEVLQMLTGKTVTEVKIASKTKEELLVIFEQAIANKKAVTIGSIPSPNGKDEATDKADEQRLYYSHTYYLEQVNQNKIELKNPQGKRHLNISWNTFIQLFSHYSKID